MIKLFLAMTVASIVLCGIAALILWPLMGYEGALGISGGAFVGCMICTWVITPIIEALK